MQMDYNHNLQTDSWDVELYRKEQVVLSDDEDEGGGTELGEFLPN